MKNIEVTVLFKSGVERKYILPIDGNPSKATVDASIAEIQGIIRDVYIGNREHGYLLFNDTTQVAIAETAAITIDVV